MRPSSATLSPSGPRGPLGRRAQAWGLPNGNWLGAGIAALAGHALLLHALGGGYRADVGAGELRVRPAVARIELVAAARVPPPPVAPADPAVWRPTMSGGGAATPGPDPARRLPLPSRQHESTSMASPPADAQPQPARLTAPAPPEVSPVGPERSADGQRSDRTAAAGPEGASPPLYLAQLPDPFVMRLGVLRGGQPGSGELRFERPADGGYRLRLALETAGRPTFEMTSSGPSGLTGLAPERFTDRRRGRGAAAANFDRAAGEVRFSSQAAPAPVAPGAQDRLSWLVQLAGVVQADETLRVRGAQVVLQVAGARGGAAVWRFEAGGPDELPDRAAAATGLLRYVREPEAPYDQRVEAWLDPARQFLPVHVRLTTVPQGQSLEIWAVDAQPS